MADNKELALENWLNRATNPINREEDWELIMGFCDQLNDELEGPSIACRLIAHKIQSPQEREALLALTTLEACVKNCGRRFHQEIGKFRFLNELIKVISPKYYGSRTTERVKKRCIEILYSWTQGLKHEHKIVEAYSMLKAQGIIKDDPTYMDQTLTSPSSRQKATILEDDEKSKLLARLLKSRSPDDLQAANRLIKNMVKEDNDRMDRVSRRINELEKIANNMKLLTEMLGHYVTSSQDDRDMMKELFNELEKNRPILFKLASETDEKDNEGISDILKANDEMMTVMNNYKNTVAKYDDGEGASDRKDSLLDIDFNSPAKNAAPPSTNNESTSTTMLQEQLSAFGLDDSQPVSEPSNNLFGDFKQFPSPGNFQAGQQGTYPVGQQPGVIYGMTPPYGMYQPQMQPIALQQRNPDPAYTNLLANSGLPAVPSQPRTLSNPPQYLSSDNKKTPSPSMNSMDDLKLLGKDWLQHSQVAKPPSTRSTQVVSATPVITQSATVDPSLPNNIVDMFNISTENTVSPMNLDNLFTSPMTSAVSQTNTHIPSTAPSYSPLMSPRLSDASNNVQVLNNMQTQSTPTTVTSKSPASIDISAYSLADITVPLETIKPGSVKPIKAYDQKDVKITVHFGKDSPRNDVTVMVVSIISTNETPIKGFTFQVAVPKTMRVKLLPPSATDLPSYNPILPPTAITQVMLLANPQKERVRLKFKIKFLLNDVEVSDVGEINEFPEL